ncbi:DUF2949 domain-containing protein [Thermocoleostomius sinensis A174]|jgi:hypothetical protein|uniref:DUF2949 domain-containing protein n=1 Tax=Thermocoleostomius sinensis A174 TaxID=2016057 RepID=A0A9E8ZB17_9CYAN|nr:DUF2949 domain-containing protein [Thermocoleostomius sinensis A174]
MNASLHSQLICFLENDLGIPANEIAMALRHQDCGTQLPLILWQYGFVTLEQLDQIFSWLTRA